jgi:hypothetical protein
MEDPAIMLVWLEVMQTDWAVPVTDHWINEGVKALPFAFSEL